MIPKEALNKKIEDLVQKLGSIEHSANIKSELSQLLISRSKLLDDQEALVDLQKVLELEPFSSEIKLQIGTIYFQMDKLDDNILLAKNILEEARVLDQKNVEVLFNLALCYLALSRTDTENEYLEGVLKIINDFPKELSPWEERAYFFLKGKYWKESFYFSEEVSDLKEAVQNYKKAEQLGEDSPKFYLELAHLYEDFYSYFPSISLLDEGILVLQKALLKGEDKSKIYFQIGCLQSYYYCRTFEPRLYDEASSNFLKSLELDPLNSKVRVELARLLLTCGKFLKDTKILCFGIEQVEFALRHEPSCREAHLIHSNLLCLQGALTENVSDLKSAEKIIRSLPELEDSSDAAVILAKIYIEIGNYFDSEDEYLLAFDVLCAAIELDPNNFDLMFLLAKVKAFYGSNLGLYDYLEEAIIHLDTIASNPTFLTPEYFQELGMCYLLLSDCNIALDNCLEEAKESFERALEFYENYETKNLDLLYNYAVTLSYLGDFSEGEAASLYEKSRDVFLEILDIDKEHTDARFNLGLCLSHLGEVVGDLEPFEKSVEIFQELLREDPEDEMIWHEWGITYMTMGQISGEKNFPDHHSYYQESEVKFLKAIHLGSIPSLYHLGCLYALWGDLSRAFSCLEQAAASGVLPPREEVEQDKFLENLHQLSAFHEFLRNCP